MDVVDDDADPGIWFKVAAYHSAVVKHLCWAFDRQGIRSKEVQRLGEFKAHFAIDAFLFVRCPRDENVTGVW